VTPDKPDCNARGTRQNSGAAIYSYVYDRFGNRWQQNGPHTMIEAFTGNGSGNNNRMDGYAYDAAGNLLNDGTNFYTYDAENRIVEVQEGSASGPVLATYAYDADGKRVHRTGVTTDTCDNTGQRDYVYDLAGNWVLEVTSTGTACKYEIHAGSRHFVTDVDGNTWFDHSDWLGTMRLRNTYATPSYNWETCTSLPFGDGLTCPNGDQSTVHFTGKERDTESGLDNFGARYDASSMGRFMSADQLGPGQHPGNPQSWNLYSYVLNNPLKLVDPSGKFTCDAKTVSDQQCDNVQAALDKAQDAADALGNKYGWDSKQYLDAQRAIDAYGDEGVDNGVTIAQGNVGSGEAQTEVAGSTVAKTQDNPNGQNIRVTFDRASNVLGADTNSLATLAAHEGVHVADGSDWVSSGFSNNALPSRLQTEWDAYQVQGSIAEGLGASFLRFPWPDRSYGILLPMSPTSSTLAKMLKNEYPKLNLDAFSRNTKLPGPQP
jgi:RHS repeat-associated protein